jgi:bacillithiol biosynthesis cysteine-adding enzyme BshC
LNIEPIAFSKLPFSKLFSDYCQNYAKTSEFFDYNPFLRSDFAQKVENYSNSERRKELETVISAYNSIPDLHENARSNIDRLLNDQKAVTIVTGQQLTIAGGPLFTIYKILTAIAQAQTLETELKIPVIPVFWLADEDHDFPEVAKIGMPHHSDWSALEISQTEDALKPVGRVQVAGNRTKLLEELDQILVSTDFKEEVASLLDKSYAAEFLHADAFGGLILRLFSKYGLIVMGSAKPEAREFLRNDIIDLVKQTDELYVALESQSKLVEREYHRQATVSTSNWFFMDKEQRRQKLGYISGTWSLEDGRQWSTSELVKAIENDPNCISPNVFMRPLLQDVLLPNIGYVAGPGEVSYYAQMRKMYHVSGRQMPVIIPRFSATIKEGAIARIFEELPFALTEYNQRIEDLEKQFIENRNALDIKAFANDWINEISSISDSKTTTIEGFDASLIGTLLRTKNDQIAAINTLRQKMIRSAKTKEEVQIKRIHRVQTMLFPNRNLQERELASIFMLNKYGVIFLDQLLEVVLKSSLNKHYILET